MKKIFIILNIALLLIGCSNEQARNIPKQTTTAQPKGATPKKKVLSPHTSTMAMVGDAHIHIDYSSPGVRNRVIFGGLLAYEEVWQAGAHQATWIETNKDLLIDDQKLPAGKYGFFTIPFKEKWTIIFNRNWDQHGKDEYAEDDDVLRLDVEPISLEKVQEHLEYKINKTDRASGVISLAWEKIKVEIPFKVL